MRVAVLDVDGTLIAGPLGGPLPGMLADEGLAPADRLAALRGAMASTDAEDGNGARRQQELFAAMLTDVPCRQVAAVVERVWRRRRERLFPFVRPLVAALRGAGFVPMLVSGGPHDLVAHLAAELEVDLFASTRYEAAEGLFTGRLGATIVGAKDQVVQALAGRQAIDWPGSLAMGNSLGDAQVLARAGRAVAFEPSLSLRALADERGWLVCDRTDLLDRLRDTSTLPAPPPAARIPATDAPALSADAVDVAGARRRLTEHLLAQVDGQGVVVGEQQGRVTETALMLTLLRREKTMPDLQEHLRTYLADARPRADAFDAAVIDSTLHGIVVRDRQRLIERYFADAAQHSSDRKKLALEAILAAVGPDPFHVAAPSYALEHHNEATWTRLRQIAIHHLQAPEPLAPELTARLLRMTERGQQRGVIESNVFAHLFALLSLHRALPGHPVIQEGITALAKTVRDDGSMPLIASEEIFYTATATAGLALARADADRTLLRAMGDSLAHHQAGNGGWGFAHDVVQTDIDCTTHALTLLHTLDPYRYCTQIRAARANLLAHQGEDGGMPTYLPGQPSEPTMTANTITALAPYRRDHNDALHRATGYLLDAQHADGTFERSWSLSESNAMLRALTAFTLARAHNAFQHHGRLRPAIDAIHSRLLATANTDGGWGQTPGEDSDPMSTAYTLTALAPTHHDHPTARAGLRYLLHQQNHDGGYTSRTDQAGPRPLPYIVPVLTDTFVLIALTHYH